MFLLHVGPIQKKKLFESHTLWGRQIGISFDDKWPAKPTEKWTILGTPQKGGPFLKKKITLSAKTNQFLQMCLLSVYLLLIVWGANMSVVVWVSYGTQLLTSRKKKFFIANKIKWSKNFPTYPWNIPQTPNQRFMKEFLSFGGSGIPGVCSKGMLGFS